MVWPLLHYNWIVIQISNRGNPTSITANLLKWLANIVTIKVMSRAYLSNSKQTCKIKSSRKIYEHLTENYRRVCLLALRLIFDKHAVHSSVNLLALPGTVSLIGYSFRCSSTLYLIFFPLRVEYWACGYMIC